LLGALAIHFVMVAVYVSPLNPLKLRLIPVVYGYIQPMFDQRWELFAPEPHVDTRMLLVSCRMTDAQGNAAETPWTDMTAAFRMLKYKYRLTPADRIDRAQHSAIHMIFDKPDPLVEKLLEHPNESSPEYQKAIKLIEEQRKAKKEVGQRLLARTASSECDRLYKEGQVREVRVRMAVRKSPPFSQRDLPDEAGEVSFSDFPWMPYERAASL
jgi:hypothetical protein